VIDPLLTVPTIAFPLLTSPESVHRSTNLLSVNRTGTITFTVDPIAEIAALVPKDIDPLLTVPIEVVAV